MKRFSFFVALSLAFSIGISNTNAATLYWDSDASTTSPGNNDVSTGANLGGTGTWDATTLNWWNGGSGVPGDGAEVAWGTGTTNSAVFWGSAGTVTIPGNNATLANINRNATGLTFHTDGYEITATGTTSSGATQRGTLTLVTPGGTAPANVVVDSGLKATISARLTGTVGYNLSGGGTLKLAENSTASPNFGGLNTDTGPIKVSSTTAVNVSNFTDGSHTILEVIGGGQIGNSGTAGQFPITLDGGTYRDTDPTPANSGFGFTTSSSRNWVVTANGGVWDAPTSTSIFLNGSTTAVGFGSVVGQPGSVLYKTGPGEIRMSGLGGVGEQTNTVDKLYIAEGQFTIGQSTILGRDDQLGAVPASPAAGAQAVTLNGQGTGATLRFNGGTSATTITLNPNRGIYLDTSGGAGNTLRVDGSNATIPGLISGPGGFTKTGGLLLTLSSNGNTYAGPTNVSAGLLKLLSSNASTGSRVSSGLVSIASGAALSVEYDSTIGGNSPQPEAPGGVSISTGANLAGNGIVSGTITLAAGGKITPGIGGGNAVLQVPNADFSGGSPTGGILQSTLGAGTSSDVLRVNNVNGLNLNGGTITLKPLATATPAGQTYSLIDYNTSYTGTVGSMIVNDLTGYDGTTVFDDVANHRIKVTVGNSAIDRTWVNESSFGMWNSDAPPGPNASANWAKDNGGGSWTNPATAANGIGATARFPATVPVGLPDAGNSIPTQTIILGDLDKTVGTMVLDNPNSLTFSAATNQKLTFQTYTGNALLDVKQGTHTINVPVTLGSSATINLAAGTSLTMASTTAINAAGSVAVNVGDGATFTENASLVATGAVTIDTAGANASSSTMTVGPITNPVSVTKTGNGTLKIITNDWTGTGPTNVNGGVLQYSGDNAAGLGNSSTITVATGAIVDQNSTTGGKVNDTIGALAGGGSWLNHGNLTIAGSNATPVTFSGKMGISTNLGGSGNPYVNTNPQSTWTTTGANNALYPGRIFTKNGTGTQIISAQLESTSGPLGGNFDANASNVATSVTTLSQVSAGTLILNNPAGTSLMTSTAPLTVASGATLGGNGYLSALLTIAAGGNLSPGSLGIGTFHFDAGTLTLSSIASGTPSNLNFELSTPGASDLIDANSATVTLGTLAVKTKLNITSVGMTAGTFPIIKYGTLTNPVSNLAIGTKPTGFNYQLVDDSINKVINLIVTPNGDFNGDSLTNAADYVTWRKNDNTAAGYTAFRQNFQPSPIAGSSLGEEAVPEPASVALLLIGLAALGLRRGR